MKVRPATIDELAAQPRVLTPRQREAQRLDAQLRRALNEAAAAPSSRVVVVEAIGAERIGTIRVALAKMLAAEPRVLNWGLRHGRIMISKGPLPRRR